MITVPFVIFLCVVALVWGLLIYSHLWWKYHDKIEIRARQLSEEYVDEIFYWVKCANARRKRVERLFRRERARNVRLRDQYRSLAAEATDQLLTLRDRQEVTNNLTRKL